MYKRPSNNPFGEWNKIPSIKNTSINEQAEFDKKWEELCTEEISESEVSSYLEKLNTVALNEMGGYAEKGWFGVSPFAWTEGFKLGSIFKPLKWLALPLIGGTVLLLAGIWKLLKEGKKQIAIARVRAWIQKLVVLADSGLKKTRSTKDSLFLIRQRYRRDILQNAVKVATCLGIDVPEKDTKPESVETSLNESSQYYDPKKAIIITDIKKPGYTFKNDDGSIFFKKGNINIVYVYVCGYILGDDDHKLHVRKYYDNCLIPENLSTNETITQDVIDVVKEIDKDIEEINKNNNWYDNKILNGDIMNLVPKDENGTIDFSKPWELSENGINVGDKRSLDTYDDTRQNQTESQENSSSESSNNTNIDPDSETSSENNEGTSGNRLGTSIPSQPQLPDDSRVDWSLMNSVKASQWFGLKHKTTNFWKEAKSVGVVNTSAAQKNLLRECGLIVSYVSQSLILVANSGVAQKYTSIMNKYIEALTNFKTPDNLQNQAGRPVGGNRFYSSNINSSMNYKIFDEDFKIFEDSQTTHQKEIENMTRDRGFMQYLTNYENENGLPKGSIIADYRENNRNFEEIRSHYNYYLMLKHMNNMALKNQSNNQTQIEGSTLLDTENIDKYLIAALSKILANTNFNEWQMHSDAYNQMMKFINELTKTVHTVIDSVAKKVEEKIGGAGNSFEQAVLKFVSSKPDAKQNRSLKNLWDNIGVSKLQQRTIVHCQEIDASPEMQYYLDMFMITVPSVIKSKLSSQQRQPGTDTNKIKDQSVNTKETETE